MERRKRQPLGRRRTLLKKPVGRGGPPSRLAYLADRKRPWSRPDGAKICETAGTLAKPHSVKICTLTPLSPDPLFPDPLFPGIEESGRWRLHLTLFFHVIGAPKLASHA
jgi:hypothetical protein